jgi:hypothetical protein
MAAEAYMARSRRPIRPCSAWESVRSEGQTNVSTVALSTGRPRIYDLEEVVRFARDSPLEGNGFELPVPRAMQGAEGDSRRLRCMPPSVDYLRLILGAISRSLLSGGSA